MEINEFLDAVDRESFIGNSSMQKQMVMFALRSLDADLLTILCLLAQNYPNEQFPTNLLAKQLVQTATVDQVIDLVSVVHKLPMADIFEKVLSKGSVEQIHRLNNIRTSWLYSNTKAIEYE